MRDLRTNPIILHTPNPRIFVKRHCFPKGLSLEELTDTVVAETAPAMSNSALDDLSLCSSEAGDNGETRR